MSSKMPAISPATQIPVRPYRCTSTIRTAVSCTHLDVYKRQPIGRFTSTDDFFHGTRAAAFGGTTAVVDFVETRLEETMREALAARQAVAASAVIDYGLHMTIGPTDIAKLDQLAEIRAAGCGSVKLYMAYGLRLTDGDLLLALERAAEVGAQPVVHAENWDVITTLITRNLATGRTTPHWHPRSRPAELEGEAAGRVIDIAAYAVSYTHLDVYKRQPGCPKDGVSDHEERPGTGLDDH